MSMRCEIPKICIHQTFFDFAAVHNISYVIKHNKSIKRLSAWFTEKQHTGQHTGQRGAGYRCTWGTLLSNLPNSNIEEITVGFGARFSQDKIFVTADAQELTNLANIINLSPNLKQVNLRLDASVENFLHCVQMLRPNGPILEKLTVEIRNKPQQQQSQDLLNILKNKPNIGLIKGLKDWQEENEDSDDSFHTKEYAEIKAYGCLNKHGRKYILADSGSDMAAGVQVLAGNAANINALYLHRLENPKLCNLENKKNVPPASNNENEEDNKKPAKKKLKHRET